MVRESIAILVICLLLLAASLRAKHVGYALAVLPVGIIPLGHLIMSGVLFASQGQFFGVRPSVVMAFSDLVSLAVACVVVVLIGLRIQSKRNRTIYLVVLLLYTVLLGWLYLYSSLQIIFA